MGFLLQPRVPSRTLAHADGRRGSPGPEDGLEEGTQPPPGSAPVPALCLWDSVSWTLAGYQLGGLTAQICLHMNNS